MTEEKRKAEEIAAKIGTETTAWWPKRRVLNSK